MGKGSPEPTVTQTDEELLGPNRVVFDNVLTEYQCQVLINLAEVGSRTVSPVVML